MHSHTVGEAGEILAEDAADDEVANINAPHAVQESEEEAKEEEYTEVPSAPSIDSNLVNASYSEDNYEEVVDEELKALRNAGSDDAAIDQHIEEGRNLFERAVEGLAAVVGGRNSAPPEATNVIRSNAPNTRARAKAKKAEEKTPARTTPTYTKRSRVTTPFEFEDRNAKTRRPLRKSVRAKGKLFQQARADARGF